MKTILLILLALTISNNNLKADPLSGQAKLDSLLAELPKVKGDTNEVNLLKELSASLRGRNIDSSMKFGLKGLQLSKKINFLSGEKRCLNTLAMIYQVKGNYQMALEYYKNALTINKNLNDRKGTSIVLGNIGIIYHYESNYKMAIQYYEDALNVSREIDDLVGVATNLLNIGLVYNQLSNYPLSIEYYHKALKIFEELKDKRSAANVLVSIGITSSIQGRYENALDFFQQALDIFTDLGDISMIANCNINIGSTYAKQKYNLKSLEFTLIALDLYKRIENKVNVNWCLGNIGAIYLELSNFSKALEYLQYSLKLSKEIDNKSIMAVNLLNLGDLYLQISQDTNLVKIKSENDIFSLKTLTNLNISINYLKESLSIYNEIGELDNKIILLNNLHKAYFQKGMYKESILIHRKYKELQDSVFSQEKADKIAVLDKAREDDVNRIQIEKQEVLLAAQESEKMFIIYAGIGIIAFVIAILVLIAYQRKKSDKLLYNVLPISIAKRLKKKEHPISDHFVQASIIFIDIVGFTAMSNDSDPTDIVQALNKVFTHYDSIASKHGLEKIKTIGDCYMAAAGIPVVQNNNTLRAARMAIEVRDYMIDYYTDHGFKLDVRIGLDCGPVVAGVIGEKKFIYDLWSDAVNTASRMESSSIAGEVHVSERFKEAVSEYEEFSYVERGEIDIKGKGKMKTFFIGEKKAEVV